MLSARKCLFLQTRNTQGATSLIKGLARSQRMEARSRRTVVAATRVCCRQGEPGRGPGGETENSLLRSTKCYFCSSVSSAGLPEAELPGSPGTRRTRAQPPCPAAISTQDSGAQRPGEEQGDACPVARGGRQSLGLRAESLPLDRNLLYYS